MTMPNGGNSAVVKERVNQLECRVEKIEETFTVFSKDYNADRTWQAEWRGRLEVMLANLENGIAELKSSFGRRKGDRVKILVAVVVSVGALLTTLLDKIF